MRFLLFAEIICQESVTGVGAGELVQLAIRGLYQKLDEQLPAELVTRLNKAPEMNMPRLFALLRDARAHLGKRGDLNHPKDLYTAVDEMLSRLDPYAGFIRPEDVPRMVCGGQPFAGIGLQLRTDAGTGMIGVITPIKDGPAYKAGVRADDIITTITREVDSFGNALPTTEVISTKGLPLPDAVKKLLGLPQTTVHLTVQREGKPGPLEFELERGPAEIETVLGFQRKTDDSWDFVIDPETRICYVHLTSFGRNTSRDFDRTLTDLRQKDIKGLILDLRFNPGGLFNSAVEISDKFIEDGLIVTTDARFDRDARSKGESKGSLLDVPMACLVNGDSASSSEIVAACLQDHKRAVIMGERSHGKGSVQNLQHWQEGELKLTTAREREELAHWLQQLEIIPVRDGKARKSQPEFKDRQLEMALKYLRTKSQKS